MLDALRQTGILQEHLFRVEGDLVEHYNRALHKLTGKQTELRSFQIDKRGESPEIEDELGYHYLQTGPAHRYCIVVSPDQKYAKLIHEEFSFDHELLDFLYDQYWPGISIATRVDSLSGEMDDGVRAYETLDDLLEIQRIHVELETLSDFLKKARELQRYVLKLQKNADLLIERDSAVPKKILALVSEVGDVRNYNLSPIEVTREVDTFYTRLFDGVCVFRHQVPPDSLHIKRPDQEQFLYDLSGDPLDDEQFRLLNILDDLGESANVTVPEATPHSMTTVVYHQGEYHPLDGPQVTFIPLQETGRVVEFLRKQGYAEYAYDVLEARLSRMEDETLLAKGHDVTRLTREQRLQYLHQYRDDMLETWYELKDVKRHVTKGHAIADALQNCVADTKAMLLVPTEREAHVKKVVEHLLSKLYPQHYEQLYRVNQRDLERAYALADEGRRKYIIQVLRTCLQS